MKLVLFDIDGTLIGSGGAGRRALELAFRDVLHLETSLAGIPMAGRTDIQIIKDSLAKHSRSSGDGLISSILDSYLGHLQTEVELAHLKPGVNELLKRLALMSGIGMGLLTGNVKEGAMIKLAPFDLWRYFSFGAFGSDSEDRDMLLPVAVRRFRELTGKEVDYCSCVVMGDTPWDVRAARPYGALTVAVASGPYSIRQLKEARADLVMNDLTDREFFLDNIS